jgi:hypothetical protein
MFRDVTGLPNICRAIDGTNIQLTRRSSLYITPWTFDFFNMKKFHSVVLHAVCDMNKMFWNVCTGQPGGVHDAGQFRWSSLYQELLERTILSEPSIHVKGVCVQLYLIGDTTYPSHPYLLKNFKPQNPTLVDQRIFDSSVNSGKVAIEHAFGDLKNRWRILRSFGGNVDQCPTITIACCVLHNYCILQSERLPRPADARVRMDAFVGRHCGSQCLVDEGNDAKLAGKRVR